MPDSANMPIKVRNHMTGKITVLLVDDHTLVRRGFRRMLDDEAGITVVGEASDGIEAVRKARALKPRVVLMDLVMPGMNGLVAIEKIVKSCPASAVLMLSMHSEDNRVRSAVKAGARGYILKNAVDLDLASAIKRVAAGELVFDPQLSPEFSPKDARDRELTKRELEVLELIVEGKSGREIARQLRLSENTVGVHRANLMARLGIHKTADLVVYAIRKGLVNIL
jgi:DNA-binding NarL/FixJ family response regulator